LYRPWRPAGLLVAAPDLTRAGQGCPGPFFEDRFGCLSDGGPSTPTWPLAETMQPRAPQSTRSQYVVQRPVTGREVVRRRTPQSARENIDAGEHVQAAHSAQNSPAASLNLSTGPRVAPLDGPSRLRHSWGTGRDGRVEEHAEAGDAADYHAAMDVLRSGREELAMLAREEEQMYERLHSTGAKLWEAQSRLDFMSRWPQHTGQPVSWRGAERRPRAADGPAEARAAGAPRASDARGAREPLREPTLQRRPKPRRRAPLPRGGGAPELPALPRAGAWGAAAAAGGRAAERDAARRAAEQELLLAVTPPPLPTVAPTHVPTVHSLC